MWPFTRKKPTIIVHREDEKPTKREARQDSWTSALSGLGMPGVDKRLETHFVTSFLSPYEAMELWRGDDIASRIIETLPNEGLRQGFELCIDGDEDESDLVKEVTTKWEDLGLQDALWNAWCYENCYGGSGIYLGTTDGSPVEEPLDLRTVTALNFLTVMEPMELQPIRWQNDPRRGKLGEPSHYRLNPMTNGGGSIGGVVVHASRIIAFPGIRVSRRQVSTNFGWGDSRLARCRDVLRDFHTSWAAAGVLVQEFAQAVYKVKGLSEIIAFDKDKEFQDRVRAMELASSVLKAKVVDADGEDYKREQTPVTGLSDLLDRFATRLAAAADMPVTLLMGQSPAGLNATGESDIRFFYDRVKAAQVKKIRPVIERVVRVLFAAMQVDEPEDWSIKFPPLWQPTEKEQAETRLIQAQVDEKEILNQVVTPEEVRESRHGGREWNATTRLQKQKVLDPTIPMVETAPGVPALVAKVTEEKLDAENRRQELLRVLAPTGKCSECNEGTGDLEIDHVNGRDWQPREMTTGQRIEKYWSEYKAGVKLRALCRSCNGTDGAHRSHGNV